MHALLQKLRHPAEQTLLLLNAPPELGVTLEDSLVHTQVQANQPYATILGFADSRQKLEELAPQALALSSADTRLWFAYPKKSSGIKTDIHRDAGWDYLVNQGYGAVSAISINSTWSALRFRPEAEVVRRGAYRTNQPVRKSPPKSLEIPPYIVQLLAQKPREKAFFEHLAYTYRKEYVQWIEGAKRQETRERRIEQFITLLAQQQKSR